MVQMPLLLAMAVTNLPLSYGMICFATVLRQRFATSKLSVHHPVPAAQVGFPITNEVYLKYVSKYL